MTYGSSVVLTHIDREKENVLEKISRNEYFNILIYSHHSITDMKGKTFLILTFP